MCLFVVRAHLLQGLMYCTFRDALLYRLVVTRSYMSFCTFPISSKDTSHSPLTSGIIKLVLLKELKTKYFLFFRSFSVTPFGRVEISNF